jgi:hypothetical protein
MRHGYRDDSSKIWKQSDNYCKYTLSEKLV